MSTTINNPHQLDSKPNRYELKVFFIVAVVVVVVFPQFDTQSLYLGSFLCMSLSILLFPFILDLIFESYCLLPILISPLHTSFHQIYGSRCSLLFHFMLFKLIGTYFIVCICACACVYVAVIAFDQIENLFN